MAQDLRYAVRALRASPAFTTVAGLLAVAASGSGEVPALRSRDGLAGGYFERVGEWLKTGFA